MVLNATPNTHVVTSLPENLNSKLLPNGQMVHPKPSCNLTKELNEINKDVRAVLRIVFDEKGKATLPERIQDNLSPTGLPKLFPNTCPSEQPLSCLLRLSVENLNPLAGDLVLLMVQEDQGGQSLCLVH